MNRDAGKSLCGNVLSGAILGPDPIKRLVAKGSSAADEYLAKSEAVGSLASVILDEYRSAKLCLTVQPFPVYTAKLHCW
jgi:hypothetical protein